MLVRKKAKEVYAYCLGTGSAMEAEMIAQGKIRRLADGSYRVFSQETDTEGQAARPGDYFKIDNTGAPYPNEREYFENNHTHIRGDLYQQTAPVLQAWSLDEPMGPEIERLVRNGQLRIDESSDSHYYTAFLWGAWLHAAKDAVIIFDSITDTVAEFHFITREEFDRTYEILVSE